MFTQNRLMEMVRVVFVKMKKGKDKGQDINKYLIEMDNYCPYTVLKAIFSYFSFCVFP